MVIAIVVAFLALKGDSWKSDNYRKTNLSFMVTFFLLYHGNSCRALIQKYFSVITEKLMILGEFIKNKTTASYRINS